MFSSYELKSYLSMEHEHLVIYLLLLLVGLLLAYRHKLKDRTAEIKDDDKTKKEKTKSKKLFSKSKDKQSINGIRNRKNEPILNEIKDEKMGLLQSKQSPKLKVDDEKIHQEPAAPIEAEKKPGGLCNGTTNYLQQQQNSSLGGKRFLSDELKPNTDPLVKRHSSLKILHDSIGVNNILKSEEIDNIAVKHVDVESVENKETTASDHINDEASLKSSVTSLSHSNIKSKTETDISGIKLKFERTDLSKNTNYEPADNSITQMIKTINSNVKNETEMKILSIEPKTEVRDSIVESKTEPANINIKQKTKTDSIIKPKFEARTLSVKPKTTINFSSVKPKTDSSITSKTETTNIKHTTKRTDSFSKPKTENTDTTICNHESKHAPICNSVKSEIKFEPTRSNIPDDDKPTIDSQIKVINQYATTSSTSIVNSAVRLSGDITNIIDTELIEQCNNENIEDLVKVASIAYGFPDVSTVDDGNIDHTVSEEQHSFVDHGKIVTTSVVNNTYKEIKKDDNLVVTTVHKLPVLDDKENILTDKVIEGTPVNDKDYVDDVTVIANSFSSRILSNVSKELKSRSKKTSVERYSDKFADVIINSMLSDYDLISNDIHHEALDELDAGPHKTVNLSLSNSCKEIISDHSDEKKVKQDVNVVMSNDGIVKITTNIERNNESSNNLKNPPAIFLNDLVQELPNNNENTKPVVILRRSKVKDSSLNHLSDQLDEKVRYSGTDRPLSGYAEQLAELLAYDEDLDFEFDSDEELPDALEKIKETFQDKGSISIEIGKIQHKCSRVELNEYGVKKFKSKVKSKIHDRKTKLKGDRPLSLYEQDLLSDWMNNEEEFDDSNEVAEDMVESVQSSVQLLENKLPFNRDHRTFSIEDYDSLDESTKCHYSETKSISTGKAPDIGRAAVIDLGSGILKAGMCGQMEPSCYCPSVIGVPRRFSQDVSQMKKGYYVGDETWSVAGMLSIDYPVKQHITNWPDVTNIIEHLLDSELKVNDRAHPIMLTEMGLVSSKQREKLTEIMFETFGVPAFYLANQAALALYSVGITTGICVNSGFTCTQSVPVYEGNWIPHGTVQLDIGGDDVTKHLGRILLGSQRQVFNTSSEKLVLNSMKQRVCYVCQDSDNEEELYKSTVSMLKTYMLPDGQEIELGTERFHAPEILFNPQLLGLNKPNTAEIIQTSVDLMERSLEPILKENIVVSGGTTKLPGYGDRLQKELALISGSEKSYNIKYVDNPLLATWIGGSVLSSIGSFRDQWITIDQYADCGSKIVHKVCF